MAIVISGVNNNDKITASDGTIDLLSGVSYASTITAPAFTTAGEISAGHINIPNNIQLGQAGVVTATTFVGNLTGNVNATSNLLLQIGGSEKFRVASSGQLGIGGANYGTSGQVLTSGGSGSAATWSAIPSQVTINNASGNRVVTSDGGTTLNGEDTLRYDGTNFLIGTNTEAPYSNRNLTVAAGGSGSTTVAIEVRSPTTGSGRLIFSDGTTADDAANEGQVIYDHVNEKLLLGVAANYQNVAVESTGGTGADLHIIDGNLKLASGHGIDFSATSGTPSNGGEILDDYEEGNFTASLGGLSNWSTYSVTGQGHYVKIGKAVHLNINFGNVDLNNSSSGSVIIFNLPFVPFVVNPDCRGVTSNYMSHKVQHAGDGMIHSFYIHPTYGFRGQITKNNTSWTSWDSSNFTQTGVYIDFSATYFTAS